MNFPTQDVYRRRADRRFCDARSGSILRQKRWSPPWPSRVWMMRNAPCKAAKAAFPIWAATPIAERQAWMRKLRDEVVANEDWLRSCVHHEMGKPWAQTEEDWDRLGCLA